MNKRGPDKVLGVQKNGLGNKIFIKKNNVLKKIFFRISKKSNISWQGSQEYVIPQSGEIKVLKRFSNLRRGF